MQSLIISFHAARHPLLQTGIFVGVTKSQSYCFFRYLANYFYNHTLVWGTDSAKKNRKKATSFNQHDERDFSQRHRVLYMNIVFHFVLENVEKQLKD